MESIHRLDQVIQIKAKLNTLRGAHSVMEIRPNHPLNNMMIIDQVTIVILETGDGISPVPFSCHRLEKFIIFLPNLNIPDSASLLPINVLLFQNIFQV